MADENENEKRNTGADTAAYGNTERVKGIERADTAIWKKKRRT